MMTRTAEQCCALVEAIAVASSVAGLDELRQSAQRDFGLDVHGGFQDVLIELRPALRSKLRIATTRLTHYGCVE
jgi:hypothetical protein